MQSGLQIAADGSSLHNWCALQVLATMVATPKACMKACMCGNPLTLSLLGICFSDDYT